MKLITREQQIEEELESIAEEDKWARENIKKAEEALAKLEVELAEEDSSEAKGEKTSITPNEKKNFFAKRKWEIATLLAALGIGGYGAKELGEFAGKYVGGKDAGRAQTKKIQQEDAKKETGKVYTVSPETNLTALAKAAQTNATEQASAKKPLEPAPASKTPAPNIEEKLAAIKAELKAESEKELAKKQAELDAKLAAIEAARKKLEEKFDKIKTEKSALSVSPKPASENAEEKARRITDEAMKHNIEIMRRQARTVAERTRPMDTEPKVKEEAVWRPTGALGGYITTLPPSQYDNPMNTANSTIEKMQADNPFNLSREMLEKVEEVYEDSLEKIFPTETLKTWRSIKDKSAYELMSKPENKVPKAHKLLFSYLEKLQKTTGLEPKSGVRGRTQTIEKYIEGCLQKAAKDGKLSEVTLK